MKYILISYETIIGGIMTNYFGTLTPRMQNFRNKLVDSKKEVCVERAIITTKSYKENKNQPLEIKRALMLKDVDRKSVV